MNFDFPVLNKGALGVVCGPMKSGKSRILVDFATRLKFQNNISFALFKPAVDTRSDTILTRDGKELPCKIFNESEELLATKEYLIIIDEAQFCDEKIVEVTNKLCKKGKHVIIFGLDLDSNQEVFGAMGKLLAHADYVRKINAFCDECGNYSRYSEHQGEKEEQIKIGDSEYQAKCRNCFKQ